MKNLFTLIRNKWADVLIILLLLLGAHGLYESSQNPEEIADFSQEPEG